LGTVIKAGTTGKALKGFERYSLTDHMAEARAVVLAARHRADLIVKRAEEQAVEIRADARHAGYDVGFREGRISGEQAGCDDAREQANACFASQQETLLSTLNSMADQIERSKRDLLERAQHDLLAFAVMVAGHMTKRAGVADDQIAIQNAEEAIRHVGDWTDLVIRVHSRDGQALRRYAAGRAEELCSHQHLRIIEDETIDPGGCIVESQHTRVNATLKEQFKEVVTLLLGDDVGSGDGVFVDRTAAEVACDGSPCANGREAGHEMRANDVTGDVEPVREVEPASDESREGCDE